MPKYNLFSKMVILLLIMLVPIVGLYFFSNRINTGVLGTELNRSKTNQLIFFQNQVNLTIENIALWPNLLLQDPDIISFKDVFIQSPYFNLDTITLVKRIQTKLNIQERSSNWRTQLLIYSHSLGRVVTSNDAAYYEPSGIKNRIKPGWQVIQEGASGEERFSFSMITVHPFSDLQTPENADLLIEVRFDSTNIQDMLDHFKSDGRGDPLLYKEGTGIIYNRTANRELGNRIIAEIGNRSPEAIENQTITLGKERYLVNIVKSETTGWHLVDYMPLSDIVQPIQTTNRLFYISVSCLLLTSSLAAYLLYAQVQVPLKRLVRGFEKLKNGDYSIRMESKGNNEFGFVFLRFNSMVTQIQELFQTVYLEQIHVREARLKQLQSQINPHFFYNCFSFITSMAKLKNHQSIIAMSQNLSKYYRYTTRQERDMVMLSEEIDFVTHYLEIQKMRMSRIHYTVDLPVRMHRLEIPPLIIQPLVENAVVHGIENWSDAGQIFISGEYLDGMVRIIVEDDGKGMTEEAMNRLQQKLIHPMDESMGCGLWNVHQRMQLRFGDKAGLELLASPMGGVKAILTWSLQHEHER